MQGIIIENPAVADIDTYVGQEITVCHSRELGKRDNFDTQLSVHGTLQKHPAKEQYRILITDNTFAYFWADDVKRITDNATTGTRVIHLTY